MSDKVASQLEASCICMQIGRNVFSLRGYSFYKCTSCSLTFIYPRFDSSSIYDNDYFIGGSHGFGFSNYEKDKTASRGYLIQYLNWISKLVNPLQSRLLDIGAANGYFVNMAIDRGFIASGIEISKDASEWAVNLQRPVVHTRIEEYYPEYQFKVVTVLDVLEHVYDPDTFVQNVSRILEKDGLLVINVPHAGSFTAKIMGKKWHAYVPPEHWFYFDKKSLRLLLLRNGFSPIKFKVISKSFTVRYILLTVISSPQTSKLLKYLARGGNSILVGPLSKIKIFLPLYDNLTIIARKD